MVTATREEGWESTNRQDHKPQGGPTAPRFTSPSFQLQGERRFSWSIPETTLPAAMGWYVSVLSASHLPVASLQGN